MRTLLEQRWQSPDIIDDNKIKITGITIGKNEKGYWVVSFNSENHKYLEIAYSISGHVNKTNEFGQGFDICTYKEDPKQRIPEDNVTLWLIPESEEEKTEIDGTEALLALKWSYSAVIVPYSHFWVKEEDIHEQ